ncbi:flagellin [Paenibacillus sp. P32E]|uniref:flagellin N-terminal helical domain-containing protein n=1 Tax=Paenibacillus sp. P32E TaxID=1349434 RepID=UPI00093B6EC1|nr:flagellin [Paenibacillus sp. P32E]OKP85566.1 flagellin [Paenibacillus sp. P32E]
MIINHNIAALNTHRQLGSNTAATNKNIEKLSSGLRINRAGDDAAGLAISEKMRGQIRGLDMASKNGQDGISMIQTAEGAMNETHSILQRMRELAVQSSNDTNTDSDRKELQKEVSQLTDEINRISNTTEFNTKKLLDGSVGNNANIKGANALALKPVNVVDSGLATDTYTITQANPAAIVADIKTNTTGLASGDFDFSDTTKVKGLELGDYTLETKATGAANKFDVTLKNKDGVVVASASALDTVAGGPLTGTAPDGTATKFTLKGVAAGVAAEGKMSFNLNATYGANDFAIKNTAGSTTYTSAAATKITDSDFQAGGLQFKMTTDTALAAAASTTDIVVTNNALTMHIGANQNQSMKVDINKIDAKSLGINNIDITTQTGAEAAITSVNDALTKVSSERAKLGAFQNRLEHTINNLNTSSENLTAAESRIRDTDMAKEMMEQTKNNILAQAAQAMLAQANQQPQGVLQLLR